MKDLIDRKTGRMKLIDAPVGVFVFRDEFVLKTEYMTNIDGVYIPDCYILSTGEKFWGGMKSKEDFKTKYNNLDVEVIDIMPSAHLESKQQATTSSDCIIRQDAKDVVDMELDAIDHVPEWVYDRLLTALDKVPSAQPEPCKDAVSREAVSEWLKQYGQDVLHGKYKFSLMYIWKNLMDLPAAQPERKKGNWLRSGNCIFPYECDQCGDTNERATPFCSNCGANMERWTE